MKKHHLAGLIIAIGLAVPLATLAHPPWDGPGGCRHMHHERGLFDGNHLPPFLRGLNLTETQRDNISGLLKAQAPALRDKAEEAHKASGELRAMAMSGQYDEAKAKVLAEASAKAMAEVALMRARTGNQIYQSLTPEQQKQLQEKMERFKSHGLDDDENRGGPDRS